MTRTYYTIYEVTNNINGKKYRGVHKTRNQYDSYKGSGTHIKRALLKYKGINFTKVVLACALDEDSMYWLEKHVFVTDEWVKSEDTYNLVSGGAGLTEQAKNNGTQKWKNTNIGRYGVDVPMKNDEIREKVKRTTLERYGVENYLQSEEGRAVARKNNAGELNPFYGKTRTPEEITNIRCVQKSRWDAMSKNDRWEYNENARKAKVKFIYTLTSPKNITYHTDSLPMFCDLLAIDLEAFKRALRKGVQTIPEPDTRRPPSEKRVKTTGWRMTRVLKSDVSSDILDHLVIFTMS